MRKFKVLILVLLLLLVIKKVPTLSLNVSLNKTVYAPKTDKKLILSKGKNLKGYIKNHHLIAHAGGVIGENTYTNSKDAMDLSYSNGIRLMEIDFEWTTDNKLVCLHSWSNIVNEYFNVPVKQYSYEEFNNFKMFNDLQQMTPETLQKWLKEHEDVYIVTDIKRENVKALELLGKSYPYLKDRMIPQIYNFDQYNEVLDLGYNDIMI